MPGRHQVDAQPAEVLDEHARLDVAVVRDQAGRGEAPLRQGARGQDRRRDRDQVAATGSDQTDRDEGAVRSFDLVKNPATSRTEKTAERDAERSKGGDASADRLRAR